MVGQYGPPNPPYGIYNPYGQAAMMPPPEAFQPEHFPPEAFQPRLHQSQTVSSDNLISYQSEYDSQPLPPVPPRPAPRLNRRRQTQNGEHVKHRRTRSGCFTCRQRRVKCDETRPMCDRCRKGKRDCIWPETSSSKSDRGSSKSKRSTEDGSDSTQSDSESELAPIADDDELDAEEESEIPSAVPETKAKFAEDQASTMLEAPPSATKPPRPAQGRSGTKQTSRDDITQHPKWAELPSFIKFYLKYHRNHLSYQHYAWKYDGGNFLKTTFLEIALNYEPLLYAVVAYAAYHYALGREEGKVKDFLDTYNRSVSALRRSLEKGDKHNISTLLTILQLATIEEFLGDWVNLLSHQRAAYQIITDLFTPQTITQSETHRKIIGWYMRFDLFAANLGGGATAMGREWFKACADFYKRQVRDRPGDKGAIMEDFFGTARLLAVDTSQLFTGKAAGQVSDDEFKQGIPEIASRMQAFRTAIEGAFTDPSHYVQSFSNAPPFDPSVDIVDYHDRDFCYAGDLHAMNSVKIDHWAIQMLFYRHLAQIPALIHLVPPPAELQELAYKKCKMLEAVRYSDNAPPGAVIGLQASLGIAALALNQDKKHVDWFRHRFALIERSGYIYPKTLRVRMKELWGVDVSYWWLDNNEGFPSILRQLREFIDFRAGEVYSIQAKDTDVRDMAGIFSKMSMVNGPETQDEGHEDGDGMWLDRGEMYESSPDEHIFG
ncbi:hypothetical protein LTR95_008540 [Oleoguttula sp. CCFEE 5521]